jgi:hypothetical protein
VPVSIKGRVPAGEWREEIAAHIGNRLMALERELAGKPAQSISPHHDPTTPTGGGEGPPAVLETHTHHANALILTPYGDVAANRVGPGVNELSDEKLARDGSQTMLGDLPMNHFSIDDAHDIEAEGTVTVAEDLTMTGGVGLANVSGVRRVRLVSSASGDFVPAVRDVYWSALERTLVVRVASGS